MYFLSSTEASKIAHRRSEPRERMFNWGSDMHQTRSTSGEDLLL